MARTAENEVRNETEKFLFRYYMLSYFFALAVKTYNNNNKKLATG